MIASDLVEATTREELEAMGDDFANRMLFAGEEDPESFRARMITHTGALLRARGYRRIEEEDAASRSLVFGPASRWLFLGDTTGSTECADRGAWDSLTRELSQEVTLIETFMSDSCCAHLYLWEGGERVDCIGSGSMPFGSVDDEARAWLAGVPERWLHLLAPGGDRDQFIDEWDMSRRSYELIFTASRAFGWPEHLCATGYSLDLDGIFAKYDPEELGYEASEFHELHLDDSNLVNARPE